MHEHLDVNITAKAVALKANRALGLLIAKCKCIGGVTNDVFTKLYDGLVWPVIEYGSAILGVKSFSCINSVQNKAMRFFLGVGKYTPNAAVAGEMCWYPPIVRKWKSVCNLWCRLSTKSNTRINKRIGLWEQHFSGPKCRKCFLLSKRNF